MGVNLYIENENGDQSDKVLDPYGFVGCIVSLADFDRTVCLRFIDPYGNTVFNQLQIPVLITELETVRAVVTDDRVTELARKGLQRARRAKWAPPMIQSIELSAQRLTAPDILAHLDRVLDLARRARGEVHTYIKCYGD